MMNIKKLFDFILDLLFPKRCAFCHKLLVNKDAGYCPMCARDLPFTPPGAQRQKFPFVTHCIAPFYYEKDVRSSLLRYKFHNMSSYSSFYGAFMSKCIDENDIFCDIITWVPLSKKRLRKRGYDQARLLAEELSQRRGIECSQLLVKHRDTPAQSGTGNAEMRKANISGAYTAVNTEHIKGKTILLVDDIVTTGSTLSECARTLKAAGAKQIAAVAVARSRD